MKVLINHLGYEPDQAKRALLCCPGPMAVEGFRVLACPGDEVAYEGAAEACGPVEKWDTGYYYRLSFDRLRAPGTYRVVCAAGGREVSSYPFRVADNLLGEQLLSDGTFYFKAQRVSGEWLEEDRCIGFLDGLREGTRDVHGGWYDASGDPGVHMSHLSFSTYFNPQQHPFSAFVFFRGEELLAASGNPLYLILRRRYLDEAFWGADFIMRMRTESGSFFRAVRRLDSYGPVHGGRKLDYEHTHLTRRAMHEAGLESEIRDENYETSLRCGGGLCIAVLAMAGRRFYPSAAFSQREYLIAAKESFAHLMTENGRYASDGQWNLLDEYCALVAATELYKTTGEYEYLRRGRELARRMEDRFVLRGAGGYFAVDGAGRPFFHAADAGLPVVALLHFAGIEPEAPREAELTALCQKAMAHELEITRAVPNPFGLARQRVRTGGADKETFFFPHDTEAAPWWQGENARLASLATAAELLAQRLPGEAFAAELRAYAADQLNWILGLNPFDSCMVTGKGRNNPAYYSSNNFCFMSCPGGVCNGITGGYEGDEGILYIADLDPRETDNWRWAEQWIPHLSWLMYAVGQRMK